MIFCIRLLTAGGTECVCVQLFRARVLKGLLKKKVIINGQRESYWLLPLKLRTDGAGAFHVVLRNRAQKLMQDKKSINLERGRAEAKEAREAGEVYETAEVGPTEAVRKRKRSLDTTAMPPPKATTTTAAGGDRHMPGSTPLTAIDLGRANVFAAAYGTFATADLPSPGVKTETHVYTAKTWYEVRTLVDTAILHSERHARVDVFFLFFSLVYAFVRAGGELGIGGLEGRGLRACVWISLSAWRKGMHHQYACVCVAFAASGGEHVQEESRASCAASRVRRERQAVPQ